MGGSAVSSSKQIKGAGGGRIENNGLVAVYQSSYKIPKIVNLPFSLVTWKKSSTYQLPINCQPTNFFVLTNLNTKSQQPAKYQLQEIVTYQLFKLHKTYQLEISKTCKLPTFFSKLRGGPSPPWFPFIAALTWRSERDLLRNNLIIEDEDIWRFYSIFVI